MVKRSKIRRRERRRKGVEDGETRGAPSSYFACTISVKLAGQ
jgi:hypothetical protein